MFNKLSGSDDIFSSLVENINLHKIKIISLIIAVFIILLISIMVIFDNKDKDIIKLSLNGEEIINISQYEQYNEQGAKVTSSLNGDISNNLEISGSVNSSIIGTYYITYSYVDSHNKQYQIIRTINVKANSNNNSTVATHTVSNSMYTKDLLDINISIKLENYRYTILPNNTRTYSKEIKYSVSVNGSFIFNVYDTNNQTHKYEVVIANIDKIEPSASCTATTINNQTTIIVVASDNGSGIAGYSYALTNNYSDYVTTNKYIYNGTSSTAYVKVKDNAGNIKIISCPINDNYVPFKPTFIYDNTKPLLTCDTYDQTKWQQLSEELIKAVDSAGRGTRAGVVAAARFLAGLPYRIPYQGARKDTDIGQYYKLGLNSNPTNGWGCKGNGLDCSSYVSWAILNGGINIGKMYVGSDYGSYHKILDVANQIKVGDIVFQVDSTGERRFSHNGIIIGIDVDNFYVAEARGTSLIVTKVSKTVRHNVFTYVALADIYPSEGNITNMW